MHQTSTARASIKGVSPSFYDSPDGSGSNYEMDEAVPPCVTYDLAGSSDPKEIMSDAFRKMNDDGQALID